MTVNLNYNNRLENILTMRLNDYRIASLYNSPHQKQPITAATTNSHKFPTKDHKRRKKKKFALFIHCATVCNRQKKWL